jgi:glucose-6-phosphate dehydrogenase assembly protein OpcA
VQVSDKIFDTLLRATDRLVIDSAEFEEPINDLVETKKLFVHDNCENVGISDLNWARLTFWRELLADFYDVPAYQPWLDKLAHVRIDYVGPERQPSTLAPQALLIAGWLASRLGWNLPSDQTLGGNDETLSINFWSKDRGAGDREIKLEFNRVECGERKPGRLVQVELRTNADDPASFTVARSADNLHLSTEAKLGLEVHRGRVVPVRNRSAAQLFSREMEILCNDKIYQEALALATALIDSSQPQK